MLYLYCLDGMGLWVNTQVRGNETQQDKINSALTYFWSIQLTKAQRA